MQHVLMTGAAGGVATQIRPLIAARYPKIRLSDIAVPDGLASNETFMPADLTDAAAMEALCEGIDGVVHLGGHSVEGPWPTILDANIVGCYHLFEAARKAGVRRVVFASSNHAVGFYPRSQRIGPDVTVRPDSRYGVSKAFGEALGALYADKHGLGVTCLRIGNVGPEPIDLRRLAIWISPSDLVQLIAIGLEHPDVAYEILYGISDNDRAWFDNARAYALGYAPTGQAEDHAEQALARQAELPPDPIGDAYQGGTFCSDEYTADGTDPQKSR
ncbi:MAG: NAD(P)-dependent oxidoreductase [Hyphomicrobiaceae bacterium]|nr:NAD(P)-dependent oxidoreductase [Hyphomicrobiaceae bacterium]